MLHMMLAAALAAPSNDFRGVPLNGPCPTGPEWTETEADDGITFFVRAGDKHAIGDAKLTRIAYGCWTPKGGTPMMAAVFITFEGIEGHALLVTLTEQWGKPYQSNPYIDRYLWQGTTTGYLDFNFRKGSLLIQSRDVVKQREAEAKERAANASGDL